MNKSEPIILIDSNAFSKGSFQLIGVLIVVFILGLIPLFLGGYFRISLISGIAIILLMARKKVTILNPVTGEIKQYITIFTFQVPYSKTTINHERLSNVALKYYTGSSSRVARISYVPTSYDVKEFYLDLSLVKPKKAIRIKVLPSYEKAVCLGEEISEHWNLKFIDFIKLRAIKAQRKKIERQKRGLR